jgi:nicotinamide-nucleotide amidase
MWPATLDGIITKILCINMAKQINAAIITIGDELLIGQTIDTNSAWIGQQLNALGIWVKKRIAVGDVKIDIQQTLAQLETEADLIIITGGLGPTADDITKPLLCEYFGGHLIENEAVKKHVIAFFEKRKRPILDVNVAQAMVPNVCEVLWNEMGSAPGMWFAKNGKIIIALPGVPFEMKQIMLDEALPKIKTHFTTPNVIHKTACTAGKGESFIAVYLKEFEANLPSNIKLAYLPQLGGVKLRLTGIDVTEQEINTYFNELCTIVNHVIFATTDISLEEVIGQLLIKNSLTIALAESCTGGGITATLTAIKGASIYCKGAIVSYTNDVKINTLAVDAQTIALQTAVSEQVAIQMASQVQQKLQASIGVSITGYLDEPNNPSNKGLIWMSITNGKTTKTLQAVMPYNREQNTKLAILTVLNNIRVFVSDNYETK